MPVVNIFWYIYANIAAVSAPDNTQSKCFNTFLDHFRLFNILGVYALFPLMPQALFLCGNLMFPVYEWLAEYAHI